MTSTQVLHQPLKEVAERIDAHLTRLELEQRAVAAAKRKVDGQDHSLEHWSHARAWVAGSRVQVTYISFQGHSNLTRAEALHYLAALDAGYDRAHQVLFQTDPPPADPEAEVRFLALVLYRSDWVLYAVTKRTPTRVYGHGVAGRAASWVPSYLERAQVKKLQATQADLDAVLAAEKRRGAAFRAATEAYQRELDTILPKGE